MTMIGVSRTIEAEDGIRCSGIHQRFKIENTILKADLSRVMWIENVIHLGGNRETRGVIGQIAKTVKRTPERTRKNEKSI